MKKVQVCVKNGLEKTRYVDVIIDNKQTVSDAINIVKRIVLLWVLVHLPILVEAIVALSLLVNIINIRLVLFLMVIGIAIVLVMFL